MGQGDWSPSSVRFHIDNLNRCWACNQPIGNEAVRRRVYVAGFMLDVLELHRLALRAICTSGEDQPETVAECREIARSALELDPGGEGE